jgi:DNA-binding NarL/FixJ family response regulator
MIRVLIADDTLIAREGWKKILETVTDIEVVGEVTLAEDTPRKLEELKPDVLLMDLKWFDDERIGIATIADAKQQTSKTKILAITVYPHLVDNARDAGADAILPKGFSRSELVDAIRAVHQAKNTSIPWHQRISNAATEYAQRLEAIKTGKQDARQYEEFVEEVLPFLFEPHLTDLKAQSRTYAGTQIRDAILFNGSTDPFWATIRQKHGATHIVFEVKNVNELANDHILQLADYLKEPLGSFGIIITRAAPGKPLIRRVIETYRAHGEVVLIVSDADIRTMLETKMSAGEPTDIIRQKYLNFVNLI